MADGEYCIDISDHKVNNLDASELLRDYTIASRCRFRLTCRRGHWWADPAIGSNLHLLKSLGQARAEAEKFCTEALQDLIDDGEIASIALLEIEEDPVVGWIALHLEITVPGGTTVDLGLVPVGS